MAYYILISLLSHHCTQVAKVLLFHGLVSVAGSQRSMNCSQNLSVSWMVVVMLHDSKKLVKCLAIDTWPFREPFC